MMKLLKRSSKKFNPTLLENQNIITDINSVFPENIQIYQRANLTKIHVEKKEVIKNYEFNEISMVISFGITGELKGFVICESPIVSFARSKEKYNFIQGLYVEAMNILLGKIMTNIENDEDTLCYITPPKLLSKEAKGSILLKEIEKFKENSLLIEALYHLETQERQIPCHLYFEIQNSHSNIEV